MRLFLGFRGRLLHCLRLRLFLGFCGRLLHCLRLRLFLGFCGRAKLYNCLILSFLFKGIFIRFCCEDVHSLCHGSSANCNADGKCPFRKL